MTDQLPLDLDTARQQSWAVISDCHLYRYELGRRWASGHLLEWVMFNPSTANDRLDDPTIRRCIGFAKDWGFAGIRVTNLFALRATNPDDLKKAGDPFGPNNHDYLSVARGPITVCGWGTHSITQRKDPQHLIDGSPRWNTLFDRESALVCLGYNKDGSPKHPLYVPKSAGVRPWPKPDPKERNY